MERHHRPDPGRNGSRRGRVPRRYAQLKDAFRPGLTVYYWKYTRPGEHYGMSFDGLIHVNGHWALFPKPWRRRRPETEDRMIRSGSVASTMANMSMTW